MGVGGTDRKHKWEENIKGWTGLDLGEALRKLKTEKDGGKWLPDHPWWPNGHPDSEICKSGQVQ